MITSDRFQLSPALWFLCLLQSLPPTTRRQQLHTSVLQPSLPAQPSLPPVLPPAPSTLSFVGEMFELSKFFINSLQSAAHTLPEAFTVPDGLPCISAKEGAFTVHRQKPHTHQDGTSFLLMRLFYPGTPSRVPRHIVTVDIFKADPTKAFLSAGTSVAPHWKLHALHALTPCYFKLFHFLWALTHPIQVSSGTIPSSRLAVLIRI